MRAKIGEVSVEVRRKHPATNLFNSRSQVKYLFNYTINETSIYCILQPQNDAQLNPPPSTLTRGKVGARFLHLLPDQILHKTSKQYDKRCLLFK